MGEVSAAGDRDPYMQAYITARMKNQVEEMKLQKLLASMEMSQRLRKIMINLELFEDRKNAHRLQKEVNQMNTRQKKNLRQYLSQQATRHHMTSAWTTTALPTNPSPTLHHHHHHHHDNDHTDPATGDVTQPQPVAPHPPPSLPVPSPRSHRGVYLTTKGRECAWRGAEEKGDGSAHGSKDTCERAEGRKKWATAVEASGVPVIRVTDYSPRQESHAAQRPYEDDTNPPQRPVSVPQQDIPDNPPDIQPNPGPSKTATMITVIPSAPPMSAPERTPHPPAHPDPDHCHDNCPPPGVAVHFPPVAYQATTRPGYSRVPHPPTRERKRLPSASQLWPGDPRAIGSVRRSRRNIQEMVAAMKAGEETRRLLRADTPSCSRNCGQLGIMSQLEKTYTNVPDLLPEIEKARQRLAGEDGVQDLSQNASLHSLARQEAQLESAGKRRALGRFDIEEDVASTKNLPIYQIDYKSLRNISGSRKNSVFV